MGTPQAIDEILAFAIRNEEESNAFYTGLAARMENRRMRDVFEQFAAEELGHKKKLEEVRNGKTFAPAPEKIMDLKIAEYIVIDDQSDDMDYQHALMLAMKREKKAFKLYTDLSEATTDDNISTLFKFLAQEEAKHKLRFEIEYDEYVLNEN